MTELYQAGIYGPDGEPATSLEVARRVADGAGLGGYAVEPGDPDAPADGIWLVELTPDLQRVFERDGYLSVASDQGHARIEIEAY